MYKINYEDIAIPIAWPDQTARGDEQWYSLLKSLGIIKNLNFKVGHAAIVLAKKDTGELRYFDFGRYIAPRGYGRARSSKFDPRLILQTRAIIEGDEILNFEEILHELSEKEEATHGGGRLYCSQTYQVNFDKSVRFAEEIVNKGPILYGALANKNNSCSRYVAQIMVAGLSEDDSRKRNILYPESLKPSPTSNVVNGVEHRYVYCYAKGVLTKIKMNRFASLKFQMAQLKDNFYSDLAKLLPDDSKPGKISELPRHEHLPMNVQWLGGIGEGVWMEIKQVDSVYEIYRYNSNGNIDYGVLATPVGTFDLSREFQFTYHIHHDKHVLIQDGQEIEFLTKHSIQDAEIIGLENKERSKII
ncbi:DUF6695 family protein [Sphingobacterium hungaricum]|uniref:Uncharacterized protein n=1 Tax=Sphingobacterium hungaricum TaxID=2082723 RepID=A0A928V1T1_9SPHI|nr:DUF6695 family protein [Sphingobacterium hungaricum]MBE8714574.1 hypothetical protein [Sphingobacterium hungaricum]